MRRKHHKASLLERHFFAEKPDREIGSSTPGKERGVSIDEYGDFDTFLYGQDTEDDDYIHEPGFSAWTIFALFSCVLTMSIAGIYLLCMFFGYV
jgi:hypothetical protein